MYVVHAEWAWSPPPGRATYRYVSLGVALQGTGTIVDLYPRSVHEPPRPARGLSLDDGRRFVAVAERAGSVPLRLACAPVSGWPRQRWAHWRVTGPPGGLPPGRAGVYLAVSVPAARTRLALRVRLRGQVGTWLFGRCFSGCAAGPDEAAVALALGADATPPGAARAVRRPPGAAAGARGSRADRGRR